MEDLMNGQQTWWGAWRTHHDVMRAARRKGLCMGNQDRRAVYGSFERRWCARLEQQLAQAEEKKALAVARRRRAPRVQTTIDALRAELTKARKCLAAHDADWKSHRRWCRCDCGALDDQRLVCSHDVPLVERCMECVDERQLRKHAMERESFLRFQQEYYHERDRATIDDVSAGGKDLDASVRGSFDDDCHLDDDCFVDAEAQIRQLEAMQDRAGIGDDLTAGAGGVTPARDFALLEPDAIHQPRKKTLL